MSVTSVVNNQRWLPSYHHHQEHIYILLTSLNLGGAEKIVSDQLWANHYSKYPKKITLIVIYDKQKEHSLPPEVNVVRLQNNIINGELLFKQIVYEEKPLVCHLINDKIAQYLFDLGLFLHLVVHNDKRGWANTPEIFNHPQIISIVAVAKFVKAQLEEVVFNKPIYNFRHHIKDNSFAFKQDIRKQKRDELKLKDDDIVIGMIGRICQQKNYFFALDVLANLIKNNPNYKLIILGGFEPQFLSLYTQLLQKINALKLHNHVILPGFKTDPHNWMNVFDIGLNTSYFEGLSMATQEFMRNGLPMVLSRVCGQPEIIDSLAQLHFFDLPELLDTPETHLFYLDFNSENSSERTQMQFKLYLKQVHTVSNLIRNINHTNRIQFTEEDKKLSSFLCYGSHNNWNLLNHIYPLKKDNSVIKPVFITSNLNAGGAQRSLINLLLEFKKNDILVPLVLLNQSNQKQYFNEITQHNLDYYLCHASIDVFDICTNLFTYFHKNNINKIVFWNVDAKMKLLISKFFHKMIDIVDVSPGDYVLEEMQRENTFQEAIYYNHEEYFSNLNTFVSKYDNTFQDANYKKYLKNQTVIIPNGVPISVHDAFHQPINNFFDFKLLVCGRITPSKHLHTIFSAWKMFSEHNKNKKCILDVYGSVEPCYLDYYEQLNSDFSDLFISGIINWKGYHETPTDIMKNYHTIVVLGTHQGSPNMVLEAGSCLLPIIANDSGGTKEIINKFTGYLLPENSSDIDVYNSLNHIYHHYEEAKEKSKNCLNHIQENFSMKKMAQSYKDIIYGK